MSPPMTGPQRRDQACVSLPPEAWESEVPSPDSEASLGPGEGESGANQLDEGAGPHPGPTRGALPATQCQPSADCVSWRPTGAGRLRPTSPALSQAGTPSSSRCPAALFLCPFLISTQQTLTLTFTL